MKVSLTALEIFREVARDGSVTGAARRLNRVQSNVSTRLKQTEQQLGVMLFHRQAGGLVLTEEGRKLLPFAQRILSMAEEAEIAVSDPEPSGRLAIGTMESTAASRLPPILSAFHARHPMVDLSVVTDTAGGLIGRLKERQIDICFVAEPVDEQAFDTFPVFSEALVLVGPATGGPISDASAVSGHSIVAFEEGCAYRIYLQRWLDEQGIKPRAVLSVGSYLAMLACVSAGVGYAVVPASVLAIIDGPAQLERFALPAPYSGIRTLLVSRRGESSAKIERLREIAGS